MENVLVYGLKESGISMIEALIDDFNVFIFDDNKQILEKTYLDYNGLVKIFTFCDFDLKRLKFIAISPAISIHNTNLIRAKELGVEILGEMEIGYKLNVRPIVSVTGSNGKSTTVKMIEYILNFAKMNAKAVGNIGEPITKFFGQGQNKLINEVSSFQLETIKSYRSPISVILNVTENHLDRHLTFENYLKEKLKLIQNQTQYDIKILNFDDENLNKINLPYTYYFSLKQKVKGAYFSDGFLWLNVKKKKKIISQSELKIKGEHNIQNALASILVCHFLNVKLRIIKKGLKNFEGLKHRLNIFEKKDGIIFVNDSKSTSVDSCLKAVKSFDENIILLLGGKDKNLCYIDMFKLFPSNVKILIFYGEIRQKLKNDFLTSNAKIEYFECENLKDATNKSIEIAKNKDVVLLSPATSSFDEFSCFEERGEYFEKTVKEILNGKR